MVRTLNFARSVLSALSDRPRSLFSANGVTAHVAIPDYDQHVAKHYGEDLAGVRKALGFHHFGAIISFEAPLELVVHNEQRQLDGDLRKLVERFGPVLLRNVQLPARDRQSAQRNIFPDLKFHLDRGHLQAEQISMFWRDPRDPVQAAPRTSSTLIMQNHVAALQARTEGHDDPVLKPSYELLAEADTASMIGKTLLELPWNAAHGVGELSLLDNRNVMHASYYPRASDKGYPISVRYLE